MTLSAADVFVTPTVYFTFPPGSFTVDGSGVFVTSIDDGLRVFVNVQVTWSPYATVNFHERFACGAPVAPPFSESHVTSLK